VRRLLVILGLVFGLAAPALAQPAPTKMRQPEYLPSAPSGFRLSGAPAKGGAYRYRLMIAGAFCVMLTAGLVARYLRKVNRSRPAAP
jgi:hypothetical protein